MLLDVGTDQQFFQETTAKFLDERAPVAELRRLRDDPAGFDPAYWRQGAELGWASLLVSEERGGGSLSQHGIVDLALLAYEFGRHGAPGPLLVTNVVAAALDEWAGEAAAPVLAALLSGSSVATWWNGFPLSGEDLGRSGSVEVRADGGEVVVTGTARAVESADRAEHLLVTGRTGDGLTQVLVPAGAGGLTVSAMRSIDLTRRFSAVRFDDVRVPATVVVGEVGAAASQAARQLQTALVVSCAESVGAMQAAFDLTLAWAFDRYSFGRPLASYQEIKHRFADMKTWLEASHAASDAATAAVAEGAPVADELLSAAKAFIGDYGSELLQDCIQLHGGIGVTFDHDLHIYLRRHTVDRALYGTPADHRQRLADRTVDAELRAVDGGAGGAGRKGAAR